MREAGLTKQERHLVALLRIWTVIFLGAGILFAIAPDWTIDYIESIGRGLFKWKSDPLVLGNERFWLVLVISLMITLAFIAYKAQAGHLRNIGYTSLILISKLVSSVGYLVCFFMIDHRFLYLAGASVDGLVFLMTIVMYRSALRSRPST